MKEKERDKFEAKSACVARAEGTAEELQGMRLEKEP
jgi:hypothetical protein